MLLLFLLLNIYQNPVARAQAPLVAIKIPKKTSPQRWRFSFALKRNKTKHEQILHENILATRE